MAIGQLVFLLMSASAWMYLATARRSIDVFTLAAISGTLFFFPAYFGTLQGPPGYPSRPVEPELYVAFSGYMAMVLVCAFVADRLWRHRSDPLSMASVRREAQLDPAAIAALGVLWISVLAVEIQLQGMRLVQGSKSELIETDSGLLLVLDWLAPLLALPLILRRGVVGKLIACGVLLFTLLVGSRAATAMTVVAVMLIYGQRRGRVSLIQRYTLVAPFIVIAAILAGSLVKPLYSAFRISGFAGIALLFSNWSVGDLIAHGAEFMSTQYIFNEIVRTNFQTDGGHLLRAPLGVLPIPRRLYTTPSSEFNDLFQPVLFADRPSAMAYNPFGEAYAGLGLLGVGVLLVIAAATALILSRLLQMHRRTIWTPLIALTAAVLVFYGHRNSAAVSFGFVRNLFWPYAACIVFASFVGQATRKRVRMRGWLDASSSRRRARLGARVGTAFTGDVSN